MKRIGSGGRAASLNNLSALDNAEPPQRTDWGAIQPSAAHGVTKCHFVIRARLELYQELRIVGDSPQLGGNDTNAAISLVRESPQSPLWSCTAHLTSGVPVTYRYIIMNKGTIEEEPNKGYRTANPKVTCLLHPRRVCLSVWSPDSCRMPADACILFAASAQSSPTSHRRPHPD